MRVRRTVPPVGYRVRPSRLLRGVLRSPATGRRGTDRFLEDLAGRLGVRRAFAVSSGKGALAVILGALHSLSGRRKVILPAYTCFSVPSAILRAGLEPVPCDIEEGSFDYDHAKLLPMLQEDVLCVLSTHLFGVPADPGRILGPCRSKGIFVVEDAAQALGGAVDGQWLGTLADVGFYSLGRGKNITCGGGGIIVSDSPDILEALDSIVVDLPSSPAREEVATFITLLVLGAFISPGLYWFPAGLPFLKLGETIFYEDFPVYRLSSFRASILDGWYDTLSWLNGVRRANSDYYLNRVPTLHDFGAGIPYLRFPVVLDGERKRRVFRDLDGTSVGINGMYPSPVSRIPELVGRFRMGDFPEAERVAESLITLPTHPLVSEQDRARVCALLESVMAPQGREGPAL